MYEFSASGLFRRIFRVLYWAAHFPLLLAVLWVIGLAFCQPLCALPVIPFIGIIIWRMRQWGYFPVRRWIAAFCACEAAMFYCLPGPDTDHWQLQTARVPGLAKSADGILHISNLRDFVYRSETSFDVRYLEEDFDTRTVSGVFLIDSRNAAGDCNLLLSFAFADGRYLVISPEMRIPADTARNSIRAYYKNYGLIYIFGTEEDLLLSRTNILNEHLHLYPLKADGEQARLMLLQCVRLAQEAAADNSAYNPITQQFSNGLLSALRIICPELEESGVSNESVADILYENGALDVHARGDWAMVQRAYAPGYNIRSETREAYSDALRQRLGMPVRAAVPERHVQEHITESSKRPKKREAERTSIFNAPSRVSVADIPEPGERLAGDHRPSSTGEDLDYAFPPPPDPDKKKATAPKDEQEAPTEPADADGEPQDKPAGDDAAANTRALDQAPSLLPRKPSLADAIPEPGARLREDARKAEEEEEREAEASTRPVGNHNFDELFFGRKPKKDDKQQEDEAEEEKKPDFDPFAKPKKKNPFEEEKPKKKSKDEIDDPFKPKEPIRI